MESTSPSKQAPITSDFILPEKQEIFANKPLDDNDQIGLQENVIIQQYRRTFWDQCHVIQKQGDSDPLPFLHVKDWHDLPSERMFWKLDLVTVDKCSS